ncbi:MAG: tetratricopeptide repeat-containing sulfotransferase family protein [Rhodanobacteraceae bacterium]
MPRVNDNQVPGTPPSPVTTRLLARARREWEGREFDAARRSLDDVLALAPGDPKAVRMLGMVTRSQGDYARAVECFLQVLGTWPEDPFLRTELGLSLASLGDVEAATSHFRYACKLAPDSWSAWFNLGEVLWRQAHAEEAVAVLQRAVALEPQQIEARLALARAQASLGRIDAAVAEFREVVRRDPVNADAWYGLSMNLASFDPADTACLQRAFGRGDLSARAHYLLGFAFAKALEGEGDYAKAFEVFRLANESQRASIRVTWGVAEEHRFVDSILDVFANAISPAPDADAGKEAILIIGMPRSGSTLVEHILASHPDVGGANEIKDMPKVIEMETRRRDSAFPLWIPDATPQDWQRLGREYLARTARWRRHKTRFTDKNLMNWHLAGAALAMLPAAHVIIVRRDPVETCLACWRHCFTEEAGFSCNLDDVADYYGEFWRLTRFWLKKYPAHVFDLQYEALVADPEGSIRSVLEFCGLPFDAACLTPHLTARAVLTPSTAQVRQPLHRGTARSAGYGDKLDGLRRRLQDSGALTGSRVSPTSSAATSHVPLERTAPNMPEGNNPGV